MLNTIAEQRITHTETKIAFDTIMTHVGSANSKRNGIVHEIWKFYAERNERMMVSHTARGTRVETERPVTLQVPSIRRI